MMSGIIGGMILLSIITGAVGGNMAAVSTAAMNGCGQAVELALSLAGTICLWSGVMGIAEKSGLTDVLSRMFRPVNRFLFRGLSPDSPAIKAVSAALEGSAHPVPEEALEVFPEVEDLEEVTLAEGVPAVAAVPEAAVWEGSNRKIASLND